MKAKPVLSNILSILTFLFLNGPVLVGQNTDTLSFTKESPHFVFYSSHRDIEVLDSLAIVLEQNYSRITNRLGADIEKKISVKVFPDLKAFHTAINYPDAADWVVGSSYGDELMMVSPLNPGSIHSYSSLMQVIVHEFVHIAVSYARGDQGWTTLPRWLSEGYAQYEAGQLNGVIRRAAKSSLSGKAPNLWSQLDNASVMEFGKMNGYALSVSIVEFLIENYGVDKLVLLIKDPENIESIYGMSTDILEENWVRYVETYQI